LLLQTIRVLKGVLDASEEANHGGANLCAVEARI
jgi:hypothetical protein